MPSELSGSFQQAKTLSPVQDGVTVEASGWGPRTAAHPLQNQE